MQSDNKFLRRINSALKSIWNFLYSFRKIILIWVAIAIFVTVAIALGLDRKAVAFLVIVIGLLSQAFIGLLNIIALIPIVGPIIAKVLALPFYWLLNSLGYFVSVVAIKKGYKKEVLNYRVLTVVFLVGLLVGFVLGKII
ncbi:MAG TPA: hypothetical protein ENK14_04900 [Caldithrix sp.]|nr:hypothetical protein [Caldithrix sp.]